MSGIKCKIMLLEFFLHLPHLLFKLFCKKLQLVKKEQKPFWEMIQVAVAEYQIITHLGPVRSVKTLWEIDGPSKQPLDKYQKSKTEGIRALII